MKRILVIAFSLFGVVVFGQETKKDSIKSEVIEVVTSYTPKVTDAFKIRKKPQIQLKDKSQKSKLTYTIFSAPVASTFIPKSGTVKGIDVGQKERLYSNFLAGGYGNNNTLYTEANIYKNERFNYQFGAHLLYSATDGNIEFAPLANKASNFEFNGFYTKNNRYLDWTIGFNSTRQKINWYGLPYNINFDNSLLVTLNPEQNYNATQINGKVDFKDFFLDNIDASIDFFTDSYQSSENHIKINTTGFVSLKKLINKNLDNLAIDGSIELLKGKFATSYFDANPLNYNFFTLRLAPNYLLNWRKFTIRLGTKLAMSIEADNATHFLIYPDVNIVHPIIKNYAKIFMGANGDLKTNSYQGFVAQNPFVSPTLGITQTNNRYTFFGGIFGKLGKNVSYTLKAQYADEEDKPLFVKNNSFSDGSLLIANTTPLKDFQYGNSFSVVYDAIKTLTFFAEVEVDISKKITVGMNSTYHNFETTSQQLAYNLPEFTANFFTKLKSDNWYANASVFLVGNRNDILYDSFFPSTTSIYKLKPFLDANIEGGYHFDDQLAVFVKLNNIGNQSYERFANFNVQGFQALAGLTWKFDF